MALIRSNYDENLWHVYDSYGVASSFWNRIISASYLSNDALIIREFAEPYRTSVAVIDLGVNTANAGELAINQDRVTFEKSGTYDISINNVEYINTSSTYTVNLNQLSVYGFTTDGSLATIEADVGNHTVTYENAARDSKIILGDGYDHVALATNPVVVAQGQDTYWVVRRLEDNSVNAYSLYTGKIVELESGDLAMYATSPVGNYGEIELITLNDRNDDQISNEPGTGDIPTDGARSGYENIDLSNYTQDSYTDSFLSASFGSINFTSKNVFNGAAVIEDWFDDASNPVDEVEYQQSAALRWSTSSVSDSDHNHDLLVAEQLDAIDGHLRVYVRDETSRTYNRFNEVYLGTDASEVNSNNGASTDGNGLTNRTLNTAMYGFGGNDTLTAGAGNDYIFGGTSTYSTLSPSGNSGNYVTGGDGSDYFGVGNIADGQAGSVMTSAYTLSGSAPTGSDAGAVVSRSISGSELTAELATRVATDRIADWTFGVDHLRVLANGTAIIEGLGTSNGSGSGIYVVDIIGSDAERIDVSGGNVNNEGKIVIRGLGGSDTIIGSSGNDYLYGNAASNLIVLSSGGSDRVFYDTFDATNSKQYVAGFDTANDQFYVNKRVVDAFYSAGSSRSLVSADVTGTYTQAVAYNPSVNYLHDVFYSPSVLDYNADHTTQDGSSPSNLSGADGTTFGIGIGMVAAGYALLYVPFMAGVGYALIASGTVLGAGSAVITTTPHKNAVFTGDVSNYMNVITSSTLQQAGNTVVATSSAMNNDSVSFLDFFGGSNAGDGFIPCVEFTASAGHGVYGYFALHSTTETFVFLVASSDNLVENGEAIKVAEINGLLTADDFKVYDGLSDIYNYGTEAPVVLRTIAVDSVRDSGTTTPDQGLTDHLIDMVVNPVLLDVTLSGDPASGSYLQVYDGTTMIYDGHLGTAVNSLVTASFNSDTNTYTVTDSRALGTVAQQTDTNALTGDNSFTLRDTVVNYSIAFVDGTTGIPTRASSGAITITGGNATIDGGGGTDILTITGTSDFINTAADSQIINLERIMLAAKDTNGDSVITSADATVTLDLHLQTDGFTIMGTQQADSIVGSQGNDSVLAMAGSDYIDLQAGNDTISGFIGTDTIIGGAGTDTLILSGTSIDFAAATDSRIQGFEVISLSITAENPLIDITLTSGSVTGLTITSGGSGLVDGTYTNVALTGSNSYSTVAYATLVVSGGALTGATITSAGTGYTTHDTIAISTIATDMTVAQTIDAHLQTDGFIINGDATPDSILGSTVADTIYGNAGADSLYGGAGNDSLNGGDGNDHLYGNTGNDTMSGGYGSDVFHVDSGTDTITDVLYGGTNDEVIISSGATANITIYNGSGVGVWTPTSTSSNEGIATITIGTQASGVDLTHVSGSYGFTINLGSDGDNVIGSTHSDIINGGAGNDTISGGAGNDTIYSSPGSDQITLDTGSDTFILTSLSHTGWTVSDFNTSYNTFNVHNIVSSLSNSDKYDLSSTTSTSTLYGLIALDGMSGDASVKSVVATWINDATDDSTYSAANVLVFADGTAGSNTYVYYWDDGSSGTAQEAELTLIGIFTGIEEAETFLASNVSV